MAGHFVEHDFVGGTRVAVETIFTEEVEFALEIGIRHRAGILEFAQPFVREEMEVTIWDDGLEGALAVVCDAMLLAGEPAEEIGRTIVEQVWNEMMTDTDVGFSFVVGEGRSFAIESHCHRHVARQITCVQVGCGMIVAMSLVRFGETICGFLSVGLEEKAIGMRPPDLISRELQGHLFDDSLPDEGLKIILIHKHRTLGGIVCLRKAVQR